MKTIEVQCAYCGNLVHKPVKEYTRSVKLGRKFYCNNSCGAKELNAPRRIPDKAKTCLYCGEPFISRGTKKLETRFCSRRCASAGSYTYSTARIESARYWGNKNKRNLSTPQLTLKKREAWRYEALEELLKDVPHEFEYSFGGFVYDLLLDSTKTLVEFDDPYHCGSKQLRADHVKDLVAQIFGYTVVRVKTEAGKAIPISALESVEYERQQLAAA